MSEVITVTAPAKKLVPLYEVHTVHDRKVSRTLHKRMPVEGGKPGQTKMITEKVEDVLPISFMVYFPGGHSLSFDTVEAMNEAGIKLNNNQLVDTESGDVTDVADSFSLKDLSDSKTRLTTRRRM